MFFMGKWIHIISKMELRN